MSRGSHRGARGESTGGCHSEPEREQKDKEETQAMQAAGMWEEELAAP